MKLARFVATTVALSIALGNAAFAQGGPRGDGWRAEPSDRWQDPRAEWRAEQRHDDWRAHREDRRAERRENRREERRHERHAEWRHAQQHHHAALHHPSRWDHHAHRGHAHPGRGAGPRHDLHRGGHLPAHYRQTAYVVRDWHRHELRRPPVGYHWVHAGGDYVLAGIATGVILSILLNP